MDAQTYRKAFGSFRYSSGEAVMASSDAQSVDYGVDTEPRANFDGESPGECNDNQVNVFNGTPEDVTSVFGVVIYPFDKPKQSKQRAVPVARKLKTGGVAETAGFTRGVSSGGNHVGTANYPLDAIQNGLTGSLELQNEIATPRYYRGQLGG